MEISTKNEIWEILAKIPIGTYIAWGAIIIAVITAVYIALAKMYKVFSRYSKLKDENEKQKQMLEKHDESLKQLNNSLKDIKDLLDIQTEVNLKQLRHTIVHTCDEAISNNRISAGKMKSLEEMFEEYTDVFHGNGYVKTMVGRVRKLPIVGSIDD